MPAMQGTCTSPLNRGIVYDKDTRKSPVLKVALEDFPSGIDMFEMVVNGDKDKVAYVSGQIIALLSTLCDDYLKDDGFMDINGFELITEPGPHAAIVNTMGHQFFKVVLADCLHIREIEYHGPDGILCRAYLSEMPIFESGQIIDINRTTYVTTERFKWADHLMTLPKNTSGARAIESLLENGTLIEVKTTRPKQVTIGELAKEIN